MPGPPVIPRRRVPVQLQLADGHKVSGEAYVALHAAGGPVASLADRLNDTTERFLPIAVADRHLLVRKAAIVSAFTPDPGDLDGKRQTPAPREISVEVTLSVGPAASGNLLAPDQAANDRALDHLNRLSGDFVPLLYREGLSLVNLRYVVAVLERPALSPTIARGADSTTARDGGSPGPAPRRG